MYIRFIYAYFWRGTGTAVYVGSTANPQARDKEHRKQCNIPFHKFLAKHGYEKFEQRIVEAFRTSTRTEYWRVSAARENQWMDVLGTWHEQGGQNFARAEVMFNTGTHYRLWRTANRAAMQRRNPACNAGTPASRAAVKHGIHRKQGYVYPITCPLCKASLALAYKKLCAYQGIPE